MAVAAENVMASRLRLSPRELQVITLLGRGLRCKEIGHELGISAETVKQYASRARAALQASTTGEAIAIVFASR